MAGQGSVRLVCFDLGGVLVRIVRDWADVLERASIDPHRCGIELTSTQIDPSYQFELGRITEDEFTALHQKANPFLSRTEIESVTRRWLLGMYEGADELLNLLRDRSVATACLSNTNAAHWRVMETDPMFSGLQMIERRYASHLLGCRKPDPQAYEHVEREAGVRPEQVVYFDDGQANCRAADNRGWTAYRVDPETDPIMQVRRRLIDHAVIRS